MNNQHSISNYFDYMKWLAIIGIFVFHFFDSIERYSSFQITPIFQKLVHIGSQGIHIFFILSAYFLYAKYHAEPQKFKIFYRLKKLYPQYLIAVFFIVTLWELNGVNVTIDSIIINILPIVRNLSYEYVRSINGNWWFLHTLIEFYIIFQGLLYLKNKLGIHTLMGLSLLAYFSYVLFYTFFLGINSQVLNPYSTFVLNYIYDFILGFYLYIYAPTLLNSKKSPFVYIFVGSVFEGIGLVFTKYLGVFGLNTNDLFFAVGWFFLLYGSILLLLKSPSPILKQLLLSTSSIYIIYLIHHPIITLIIKRVSPNSYIEVTILFIGSILITAIISKVLWFILQLVTYKRTPK